MNPFKRMKTPPRSYQTRGYKPNAECSGLPLLISRSVRYCTSVRKREKKHDPGASLPGYAVRREAKARILITDEENIYWHK